MNRNAKRKAAQTRRNVLLVVALMLVVCVASIGGTIAWLTDKTEAVTNTFSPSNIDIWMTETVDGELKDTKNGQSIANNTFKMVPGTVLNKDPKVVIEKGSEPCFVFLKVSESDNLSDFIEYAMVEAWEQLVVDGNAVANVYYQEIDALNESDDVVLDVIGYNKETIAEGAEEPTIEFFRDKVFVSTDVEKTDMDALTSADLYPTLTFKAAAVQQANLTLEEAYEEVATFLAS